MEERPMQGVKWRAILISLPATLIAAVALCWVLYSFIILDDSPGWYVWVVLVVFAIVASLLRDRVIDRNACPQCRNKDLERSHGDMYVYLVCYRCSIRWNTGLNVDSGSD